MTYDIKERTREEVAELGVKVVEAEARVKRAWAELNAAEKALTGATLALASRKRDYVRLIGCKP